MEETLKLIEMVAIIIGALFTIIISLVVYIYSSVVKKFDAFENSNTINNNVVKGLFEKFETKIEKNLEKIESNFDKLEKNFSIKFNKIEGDSEKKINKTGIEISMINKQLTILENEYKHLNRRVNKLDGFDSTEY